MVQYNENEKCAVAYYSIVLYSKEFLIKLRNEWTLSLSL